MKLSIITINLNDKSDLERTIASVERQTFDDFEWIVIDGGSKDGSKEVIEKNAHKFAYWVSEHDKGIFNAMNKGIAAAKGEYFFFLNSGSTFVSPDALEDMAYNLHDVDYVFCNVNRTDDQGTLVVTTNYGQRLSAGVGFWFYHTICHQGMFIKGELLKQRKYVEAYAIAADWEHAFNQLIINNGSYKFVETVVANVPLSGFLHTNSYRMDLERNSVMERYFSKREIDEKLLQFYITTKIPNYKYFISELAIRAFLQQRYNEQTFIATFAKYKSIICNAGTMKMRILNWLNSHHLFFVSKMISRSHIRAAVAQRQ